MKPLTRLLIATCLISSISLPCLSSAQTQDPISSPTANQVQTFYWRVGNVGYSAQGRGEIFDVGSVQNQRDIFYFEQTAAGKEQLIAATQLLGPPGLNWLVSANKETWVTANTNRGYSVVLLDAGSFGFSKQGERTLTPADIKALRRYLEPFNTAQWQKIDKTFRIESAGRYVSLSAWYKSAPTSSGWALAFVPQ